MPKPRLYSAATMLAVFLLSAQAGFAAGGLAFPRQGRFILPTVEAHEIFRQCSRDAPAIIDGYWEPAPADIDFLEAALPAFLGSASLQPAARPYNRQYTGFTAKGVRYIYGNFYPANLAIKADRQGLLPVIVCEGGQAFWGVVYRPDTRQFEQLAFNGRE